MAFCGLGSSWLPYNWKVLVSLWQRELNPHLCLQRLLSSTGGRGPHSLGPSELKVLSYV